MFSGKGDAFTMDEVYRYSAVDKYKTMNDNHKTLVTELTVKDGLYHAIKSGDYLNIIHEYNGFIEVLNSREEVLKFVGDYNPYVKIHAEFDYIARFDDDELDNDISEEIPDGFGNRSSIAFQGSPTTDTSTSIKGLSNSLSIYNDPLEEEEIQQKFDGMSERLSIDIQDIL
jgi:hypothetical protein